MIKVKKRAFRADGDSLEVIFNYDKELDKYFGDYPDFETSPRFTPNGRPWVNATTVGCPYAEEEFDDCGSCRYFLKEHTTDLIGICINEKNMNMQIPKTSD